MSEKELNKLEKEIEVLWNIIRLLKSCFWIHFENLEIIQAIATYQDIKKCNNELNKLIVARKNELGAMKEITQDATTVRSGKSVF
jgi:hypothetical protein